MIAQNAQSDSLLAITVTCSEAGALVFLCGHLTIDSSPELRNQLLAMLDGKNLEDLVSDLSNVSYDSVIPTFSSSRVFS